MLLSSTELFGYVAFPALRAHAARNQICRMGFSITFAARSLKGWSGSECLSRQPVSTGKTRANRTLPGPIRTTGSAPLRCERSLAKSRMPVANRLIWRVWSNTGARSLNLAPEPLINLADRELQPKLHIACAARVFDGVYHSIGCLMRFKPGKSLLDLRMLCREAQERQ